VTETKSVLKMKKVSVIIPVYGVENYIAATVQSVLEQTYKNFEVLIIDDASREAQNGYSGGGLALSVQVFPSTQSVPSAYPSGVISGAPA